MNTQFNFDDLFVLDLANNHQGSVQHGMNIIQEVGKVVKAHAVRAAIKFQFRQLDTFIHCDHTQSNENKHILRFLSTRLTNQEYKLLFDCVRHQNMLTMCTPFDEESVDLIKNMGFDIIKVASCSARDWPLLEKISEANMPVIFSTGGLEINQIDDLVSFFSHRAADFAIMHCVSIYPIPNDRFDLNIIDTLRHRYKNIAIGWSTHEDPNEIAAIQIAIAKGAKIFERHVGIETNEIKLNAYSSTPGQIDKWISAYKKSLELCGKKTKSITNDEKLSIDLLKRGVYAKRSIKIGQIINRDDVYFAMPYIEGQLDSGSWKENILTTESIEFNNPVMIDNIKSPSEPEYKVIKSAIHEVKALLNHACVTLNSEFVVEYSHHYGINKFLNFGAVIINCINREYCKKIIVQLPGQKHPLHFHKLKEETFQVLYGELHVSIDGQIKCLKPGDIHLVLPGVWHSFWTDTGCVFEEVSTTHYNNDSVYQDIAINKLAREDRKTVVDHWGRFQILKQQKRQM